MLAKTVEKKHLLPSLENKPEFPAVNFSNSFSPLRPTAISLITSPKIKNDLVTFETHRKFNSAMRDYQSQTQPPVQTEKLT